MRSSSETVNHSQKEAACRATEHQRLGRDADAAREARDGHGIKQQAGQGSRGESAMTDWGKRERQGRAMIT